MNNMKFSEVLFSEVKEIWDGYLEHPFVKAIGEGSLDKEKFKNYLIQDYLYLKDYAKVFAMGLVKASTMDEMKFYHESIKGILDDETAVHVNYLKGFGLSTEEVEEYKSELTTESYTNYMIGIALKGDLKDIAMTIMPCTWSYYYIGKHLYETYKENLKDNFYTPWIEGYASNEFREYTQEWIDYIDDIHKLNRMEKTIFFNAENIKYIKVVNVKVPLFKEIQGESNHGYLYSFVDYDYKHLIMLDDIKNEIILFEEKTNDESDNFFNEILFQKYNLNEISFKGIGNFKIDNFINGDENDNRSEKVNKFKVIVKDKGKEKSINALKENYQISMF